MSMNTSTLIDENGATALSLDPEFVRYLALEPQALRLRGHFPDAIPGLLQTPEYAADACRTFRRSVAGTPTDDALTQQRVELRMARQQQMLTNTGTRYHFVIDQAALLRRSHPGHDADQAMHRQYEHLHQLAQQPHITIRLLPLNRSLHGVLRDGLILLDLPDGRALAYRESVDAGGHLTDDPADVGQHRDRYELLAGLALDLPPHWTSPHGASA